MKETVYILVNPRCHQGYGLKRWNKIRNEVLTELGNAREIILEEGFDLKNFVLELPTQNTVLISAGGDGSMNQLCNTLLSCSGPFHQNISIGAIGLGSSNDFLKPNQRSIAGIPVRISIDKPYCRQDAGRIVYSDEHGISRQKYFVINASLGATAKGNYLFNNPGPLLKWLKRTNTGIAIAYTSVSTILGFKNDSCTVKYNGQSEQMTVSNINLLKIPYVAGSLHYNQSIKADDGRFGLNICRGMNRVELLQTLMGLEKGKFTPNKKRKSCFTEKLELKSNVPVIFECDGETAKALSLEIEIVPKALQFLSY